MAFAPTALAQVATGGGNAIFIYRTADAAATVVAANYFNAASNILNLGDVIFAGTGNGTIPKIYSVIGNSAGVVTIGMPAGMT